MIENLKQLEQLIQNAIDSKVTELNLVFSKSFTFTFPKSIGKLFYLRELSITPHSSRGFLRTELPSCIGSLKQLRKLYICAFVGSEQVIPYSIGELDRLQELSIVDCHDIKNLPDSIGQLTMLTKLNLYGSVMSAGIRIIPKTIENLKNLQYLCIDDTLVSSLPDSIGQLTSLKTLQITGNLYISELPETIAQLYNLENLELEGGYLTSLPQNIGMLKNLRYLDVSNNRLNYLPKTIGNLSKLEFINLIGNNLTSLPESIGNLVNLKYDIDAYANPLKSLPKSAANIPVKICWDKE